MSYREENGQVVLTMSRQDYDRVLISLGIAAGHSAKNGGDLNVFFAFVNRLNEGNPHYTPYRVEKNKS